MIQIHLMCLLGEVREKIGDEGAHFVEGIKAITENHLNILEISPFSELEK